jgi:hypothetical protein
MNSWITSELEKIDIKTEKLLQEFEIIKSKVSPKLFKIIFQPRLDKLNNCYKGNSNYSINDVQDECEHSINTFYENECEN